MAKLKSKTGERMVGRIVALVPESVKVKYTVECARHGEIPSERVRDFIEQDLEYLAGVVLAHTPR